jgi:hypothetical protein
VVYNALYNRPYVKKVDRVSFTEHILPMLQQNSDAQWVNAGFVDMFGFNAPHDFHNEEYLKKLSFGG